ncbi:Deoxyribodipyrimidine photo-lyase type II [Maridesulfovibrio ferrireducens]|uniref:Deoxyribodipyrimidine photo-lyase n=1 Tax=Maridesulfovibrio ferrireducens TaxID=246191 RepID=A0A1G9FU31_9BACT|nr:deoxyribodipyrimidine photo-lyase [Maridesulfovibrio ferrireducens]SDK91845.1 Deoxyribodipyrimidine photo-lyase type II [Maridesulfovibrio ferrireducens]
MRVHDKRIYALNDKQSSKDAEDSRGPVIYWMSREQRVKDNWGLLYARELAGETRPLVVCFVMSPSFMCATFRQYDFMLRGLKEVADKLAEMGIPFALRIGGPDAEIVSLANDIGAGTVVTDFDPLRTSWSWQKKAARELKVPLIEVDGRNIVPARVVSDKQEYAARTIRPKIHRLLFEYLEDFPELIPQHVSPPDIPEPDWNAAYRAINVDRSIFPVDFPSGEKSAHIALDSFIKTRLINYAEKRNNPNAGATSRLSAYIQFGQLAPQRAALDVAATGAGDSQDMFLEELIVRRELSENFCLHNADYDSLSGAPEWAVATLDDHRDDQRLYLYTRDEFDKAETHSLLWNAAQNQMRRTGYMHGYMRMYWAKKILEWSPSPEQAVKTAMTLNDKYQLDGRSPNGYVGALWSIAGLHDRAWKKRPVYGSIRYMNERGCRRKFDVDEYISRWNIE